MAFFGSSRFLSIIFVAVAVGLLFAVGMFTGCGSPKETLATGKQLEELQEAIKRLEEELENFRQGVPSEKQNVPPEMQGVPFEIERKLKDLERRLNDPKEWPHEQAAAEKMRQELETIVQTLSPVAAESILPQLIRLNWGIEALWILNAYAKVEPEQLEESQATIEELLESQPQGHFEEIQKQLENRLEEIAPQIRSFQIKQLLDQANLALEGKQDASAIYNRLEVFQEEKEVAKILPKLRNKVLENVALERLKICEENLAKTRSWSDDRTRQVSLQMIQEGLLRLIVELQLEEADLKEVLERAKALLSQCDKELLLIAAKQQEISADKLRRYQAWALNQIQTFEAWYYDRSLEWINSQLKEFRNATQDEEWEGFQNFPSLKDLFQEKLGVDLSGVNGAMLTAEKRQEIYNAAWGRFAWRNNIDTEVAYRTTRDGMVQFLLPIQPYLLDPPVAQLYQEAFSKGWQKLDGRKDQLYVAQQSAIIRKKTVEEIAGSDP